MGIRIRITESQTHRITIIRIIWMITIIRINRIIIVTIIPKEIRKHKKYIKSTKNTELRKQTAGGHHRQCSMMARIAGRIVKILMGPERCFLDQSSYTCMFLRIYREINYKSLVVGIRIRIKKSQTHCIKIIRIIWMTRIIRIKRIVKVKQ